MGQSWDVVIGPPPPVSNVKKISQWVSSEVSQFIKLSLTDVIGFVRLPHKKDCQNLIIHNRVHRKVVEDKNDDGFCHVRFKT